jgi:S-DNA-T family DNA segregation ATPase FtsK/SpoIIIE
MARKRKKKYQKRRDKKEEEDYEYRGLVSDETKKSIFIIILLVLALVSFLSLFDLAGALGQFIRQSLGSVLGWGLYPFPFIMLILGYALLRPEKYDIKPSNYLGLIILFLSYSGLFQFFKDFNDPAIFVKTQGGGYLGFAVYFSLQKVMGSWAGLIILVALLFISLLITFNTSLPNLINKINVFGYIKKRVAKELDEEDEEEWESEEDEDEAEAEALASGKKDWIDGPTEETAEETESDEVNDEDSAQFSKKKITENQTPKNIPEGINVTFAHGKNRRVEVPLSLLESRKGKPTSGDIKHNLEIIQTTLENFGIPVEMGEVSVGPTVTQFTLKPHQGIKLSKIVALQNDLALALAAHPIRIEAPIPGKSLVGLEVPNQSIAIVKLKDVLMSKEFTAKKGNLKICLGQDVSGRSWVVDLAKMPHMLIAGATGSGKSVCINNVLISLLYQYTPSQLRLIMVDPKKVELTNYNNIPHLLTPVITEANKTINALRWTVREMDERYRLLNASKKRNIESYNQSVLTNKLPYIVVVIDELADLMAVAARDVEAAIVRLAQMARAVGIHLIVATQRPSVNVITGLIKANITARIAFAVASGIDSRTIIDVSGAEKLLGKGDMLFTSAEITKPRRIQGAYLSDEEIERVIDFWQSQGDTDYQDNITEGATQLKVPGFNGFDDNGDELIDEAKEVIMKAGKASASLLQRRLRVGYARAARLLDLMEEQGIIGPAEGAKPREILVSDAEIMGIPVETTEHYQNDYQEPENELAEDDTRAEDENEETDEDYENQDDIDDTDEANNADANNEDEETEETDDGFNDDEETEDKDEK